MVGSSSKLFFPERDTVKKFLTLFIFKKTVPRKTCVSVDVDYSNTVSAQSLTMRTRVSVVVDNSNIVSA